LTLRRVRTATKINLHLGVGRRAADGYHPVRTVLQAIDFGDELVLKPARGEAWTLAVEGSPEIPRGKDNLVHQALQLLRDAALRCHGRPQAGIHLSLIKTVPAGGGLGGGSGDAGATLLLVNGALDLGLSHRVLLGIARRLGADVPFFLRGGLARGVGRGDRLHSLTPLPALHVLLAVPPFSLPTAEVYGLFDRESLTLDGAGFRMRPALGRLRRRIAVPMFWNDLEQHVFRLHTDLADVRDEMRNGGALVAGLSGSGSTVFGLFAKHPQLSEALEEKDREGWEFHRGRTLDGCNYLARFRFL